VRALAAALTLALVLALGTASSAGAKKKGHGKSSTFAQTLAVNLGVPDRPATGAATPLRTSIVVGKKFKGKTVADVNVTGIQTTGSAAGAANDLNARLSAPNGRTVQLFRTKGDQSLGPWTIDDDTAVSICDAPATTVCAAPNQSLNQPFAGTSNLAYNDGPAFTPLQALDGVAMKGAWTLTVFDSANGAGNGTSVLNQWGLQIRSARPVTS
jgi:hypothetical protein